MMQSLARPEIFLLPLLLFRCHLYFRLLLLVSFLLIFLLNYDYIIFVTDGMSDLKNGIYFSL